MELFVNYTPLTLAEPVAISDDSFTVTGGASGLPTGGNYRAMMDGEIWVIQSRTGNVFSGLRGQEGTVAAVHAVVVDGVIIGLTAGALAQLKADAAAEAAGSPVAYVEIDNSLSPYVPNPGDYVAVNLNNGPVVINPNGLARGQWFEWKIKPGSTPTSVNSLTINPMTEGELEQPALGLGSLGGSLVFELATDAGTGWAYVSDGVNLEIWS
jgi:hypothetical protein